MAAIGLNALDNNERILGAGFKFQPRLIQVKLDNPLFKLAIQRKLLPELRLKAEPLRTE